MAALLNIAGLLLNLAGVIILFLFGMPFRVRTAGKIANSYMLLSASETIRRERLYAWLGWLGLILIILGTALQIIAIKVGVSFGVAVAIS